MTLLDHRDLDNWRISPTTTHDHPAIADFLATTDGIGGRKFAADSRDVAEQLDGAFPDAVDRRSATCRAESVGMRRWVLRTASSQSCSPTSSSTRMLPPNIIDGIVESIVDRFQAGEHQN